MADNYMDYWRKNSFKKKSYDSIYDYDRLTENKVTKAGSNYSERYKNGYSASSYWFNPSTSLISSESTQEKKIESKLKESLAFICRSVNIIRHRYGMGNDKSLSVQWADSTMQYNTKENNIVFLNPSPLLDTNITFTDNQRYDVIVGQALLSSVQKHLISSNCTLFANNLLTVSESVSIVCEGEKLKIILLDSKGKVTNSINYIENRNGCGDLVEEQDYLPYDNNTNDFACVNMPAIFVNGAVQVWRSIEQVIAETAISNEYRGSIAYLYSHRNFYNDAKYGNSLKQAVKVYDKENAELVAFVLTINNVLNDNSKISRSECHSFYHPIIDMIENILQTNPSSTAESRLASSLQFSSVLYEYIQKRKEEGGSGGSGTKVEGEEGEGEGEEKSKEKEGTLSDSVLKKISDLTKNGLAPSLNNMVCKKETHCKHSKSIGKLDVGDEKGIRNLEVDLLSHGFTDVNIAEEGFYKSKQYIKDKYTKIANSFRQYIDMLRERLFIRTLDLSAPEFNMKSGNIDESSLWKLCDNSEDNNSIFYQNNVPNKIEKCHINILFDNSGSMSDRNRIQTCREIGVVLNEAVKGIPNVKLSFYSFTDSKFYKFENPEDIVAMKEQGGTDEGGAMGCTMREINNHRTQKLIEGDDDQEKTFFLAIGDGMTDGDKVKKSLDFIKRENIRFFHVGIDNAYTEEHGNTMYGKDGFAIIPSENLMSCLCGFLLKALI